MRIDQVTSRDGTRIGYRTTGGGPGLVVVHGAMQWSLSHAELAGALSGEFTVHLPDRRGRGLSACDPDAHGLDREVDDLDAVLTDTGAKYVTGVSSGAIVTLEAATRLPAIRKAAIFEPPLFPDPREPEVLVSRLRRSLARGDRAGALVTGMKGARLGPALLHRMPSWVLRPLTILAMRQDDAKASDCYLPMRTLAPTLRHDFDLVAEASGAARRFADLSCAVLLLRGEKSPQYLGAAIDALADVLPDADRVELAGVGHNVTGNTEFRGEPELVAVELRRFFTEATA